MRIVGLMSGTSADGIDACLARVFDRGDERIEAKLDAFISMPYPPGLRRRVLDVRTAEDVCRLNFELGELFARAALDVCAEAGVHPCDVDAIGSHGQTARHMPANRPRCTLQLAEPCVIAERTGITTVADFRPRDIAAGGSGAPLVPMVDLLLLADDRLDRIALNIGGIANVTILPAGAGVDEITAFDTGPGNMVIDALAGRLTDGRETCDHDGAMADRGTVCDDLLTELLQDAYFSQPPPKSTGREKFGPSFAEDLLVAADSRDLSDADTVATATALTARSIARAVGRWGFGDDRDCELIVSGGGVHNLAMMSMLREALPRASVAPSDDVGIPADAKEALAFAVLAYLTLHGRPGNVTGATGAARPAVLGKIVPA